MKRFILAFLGLALTLIHTACERHSWEETRPLHETHADGAEHDSTAHADAVAPAKH